MFFHSVVLTLVFTRSSLHAYSLVFCPLFSLKMGSSLINSSLRPNAFHQDKCCEQVYTFTCLDSKKIFFSHRRMMDSDHVFNVVEV